MQKTLLSVASDYATLMQDYFETLHSLWHQHSCAPGRVEWAWDHVLDRSYVAAIPNTQASQLAARLQKLTGEFPLPCWLCEPAMRERERLRRGT
jgi:putative salt-induced outer membrane protein YdiY